MIFKFNAHAEVVVCNELNSTVSDILDLENARRVLMIADGNVMSNARAKELVGFLGKKYELDLQAMESCEPTTDLVNEVSRKFKGKEYDMLIGMGGGSTLDLAKAVSVMAVNQGRVEEYHGTGKAFQRGIKKIMIPTTAGTGSEVTPGAVLVNPKTLFKRAVGGPRVCPDYAVLDAKLTLTMPDSVTAATGMDALGHAIESYTSKCSNPATRMYSREAFSLVFNNLPAVFEQRNDLEARKKILLGSCLAGFAIYNSNTGACHSMAYPLGIYHAVPHGMAVGLMISKVVEINVEKGCTLYSDLLDLVDGADCSGTPQEKSRRFSTLLNRYAPLKFLTPMSRFGITQKEISFLSQKGLELTPALSNNPVDFNIDDAEKVLQQLV